VNHLNTLTHLYEYVEKPFQNRLAESRERKALFHHECFWSGKIKTFSSMKHRIPLLPLLLCILFGCSSKKDQKKYLYYVFLDSYVGAIAKTGIEPEDQIIVAIHTGGDAPVDLLGDFASKKLYMSSGNSAAITSFNSDDLGESHYVYSLQTQIVTAMAIDPGRNRIYWVDRIKSTINMGSLDGKLIPSALFAGVSVTGHCTGMVVNTHTNMLYFTDSDANKIFAADLGKGTLPTEIVNTTNFAINKPMDLVLSQDGNSLYWPDTNNHIVSTDVTSGTSSVMLNDAATALFLDVTTNDLYLTAGSKVFKTHIGGATTLTQVFADQSIIALVVH
jgi:DNA-binding beta-propeller fold protein YncE